MSTPIRVLIIEDSRAASQFLVKLLSKGGYEVDYQRVDSAPDLIVCLEERPWDIAISNSSLSSFDGAAALSTVRERRPDLPFLFFAESMPHDAAIEMIRWGAQDCITKDQPTHLVSAVQRELQLASIRRRQQQMEGRVRQIEKLEALGKLAGGIAHDFNNAVSAILGWAELGARDVAATSSAAESFGQIRQQAERAAALTHHLLAYARRETFEPCQVDLNHLAGETVSLLRRLLGDQIDVSFALAPDLRSTTADPSQVEQVLMNLCLNARDAMPQGGVLRIETRNVLLDEGLCSRHPDARPGPYVLLSVSDTGMGMDAATMERIFEPFFTTKEIGQGTGLGLTTAMGVVTQYGGWIEVSSRPGEGSHFDVFLLASGVAAVPQGTEIQCREETTLVGENRELPLSAPTK